MPIFEVNAANNYSTYTVIWFFADLFEDSLLSIDVIYFQLYTEKINLQDPYRNNILTETKPYDYQTTNK
jgi:hypothetical protein